MFYNYIFNSDLFYLFLIISKFILGNLAREKNFICERTITFNIRIYSKFIVGFISVRTIDRVFSEKFTFAFELILSVLISEVILCFLKFTVLILRIALPNAVGAGTAAGGAPAGS